MNLNKTHEAEKQNQSYQPRTENSITPSMQSQIERAEQSKPTMPLMSDMEKEKIMGAIRTLDNQQKKEALMQSELEQAHLHQAKQLEALQKECRATLSKQEALSENTCRTLLESVERANQSLLKKNEELLKSRAEELQQNRNLLNSIQREVEQLTLSENLTREQLSTNLSAWRDKQTQTVRETTTECVKTALEDVKKNSEESIKKYSEQAEKVNKQANSYMKSAKEVNEQMQKWGDQFNKKISIAMLMTFVSAILIAVTIMLVGSLTKPIVELNKATADINRIESNAEIVNNQLNSYYQLATGESLSHARVSYYWDNKDYVGAIGAWIGAYWKNVLLIILIGSWVIYFIKKDRY